MATHLHSLSIAHAQIIKKWIHPLDDGTLPNVGIRTKMLNMVADMPGTCSGVCTDVCCRSSLTFSSHGSVQGAFKAKWVRQSCDDALEAPGRGTNVAATSCMHHHTIGSR